MQAHMFSNSETAAVLVSNWHIHPHNPHSCVLPHG
jgi:hypothetical protein